MSEENKVTEEMMEFDPEQLQELLGGSESEKLPPIVLDVEEYDESEFNRGIKETSYLVGKVTALLNCGLSESTVLDYLLNEATIDYNLKAAGINLEIAKIQRATQDKAEL